MNDVVVCFVSFYFVPDDGDLAVFSFVADGRQRKQRLQLVKLTRFRDCTPVRTRNSWS